MKKICKICGCEFETRYERVKCRSRKCGSAMRWTSNDERIKQSIRMKEVLSDDIIREKISKFHKEYQNRPDIRQANSVAQKISQNRHEVKEQENVRVCKAGTYKKSN